MSDKQFLEEKINNFKDLSTNYLNEINPSFFQNDNTNSKDMISKDNIKPKSNKNSLALIHQRYSNIERLKTNGVEILFETENQNENNNKFFFLDSIDSNDNNTCLKEQKSICAEVDSDTFVEFENIDNEEDEINCNKKNEIHRNNNNKNNKNELKNKRLFIAKENSNKTVEYNKPSNDSLFAIPKKNDIFHKNLVKVEAKSAKNNNQIYPICDCKDILLVDDDEFILKTSKNILKAFKLGADCAENGQECINMIKAKQEKNCNCSKSKYKLILMDITMPVMDGIEAAKNIQKMIDEKKLYDTIKIIFISAHVNLDLSTLFSRIKCAIDYFAKPISGDKYKSLLDKYYFHT